MDGVERIGDFERKEMKRPLIYIVLSFLLIIFPFTHSQAQNLQRFDGGMMIHTGYLHGNLTALNHKAEGMTFGLGGVLRYHLGNHFRLGGEGYVTIGNSGDGNLMRVSLSVEGKFLRY